MKLSSRFSISRFLTLLASISVTAFPAEVGMIIGGDPGEGLDLAGNFLYAFNIGPNGATGKIGDAEFTADNALGVTVAASDQIGQWGTVDLGESVNDNNLEAVLSSVRHMFTSGTPALPMDITLAGLETGASYKLQLLFREQCCARAFDIFVMDALILDDFNPGDTQGGIEANTLAGAFVTHEFTATAATLHVRLDGTDVTPDFADHNPAIAGLTLERTSPVVDSDADGLPDDWEIKFLGNLNGSGPDDPDSDGLNNAAEFDEGTFPTDPDTDKDGLSDFEEVSTYKLNPLKPDTDGDLLSDNDELTVFKTDPLKADSDSDGASDYYELHVLTDPLDEDNAPKKTLINLFTGGDAGEGLDMDGSFLYAINVANYDPAGPVRDAYFTEDEIEGVTVVSSAVVNGWHTNVELGETENDLVLALVMSSIRYSDAASQTTPAVSLTFTNLEFGAAYQLQLLFAEEGWTRGFDVFVDGKLAVDDFAPFIWQGGFPKTNGVVITHNFIATGTGVAISLDGRSVTSPEMTDHNAMLAGATLKLIAANADSDNDGLPDPWEIETFNGLSETANGDPDGDGLDNLGEFTGGTDPAKADTDGDGLNDADELNVHHTDPLKADSDADGLADNDEITLHHSDPNIFDTDGDWLSDGAEVTQHESDPAKADTDGDGFSDGVELRLMSDPKRAESMPSNPKVNVFTGGDAGEGLDLDGNFIYAVSMADTEDPGPVRDANFTSDAVAGITVTSGNSAPGWRQSFLGDSSNDYVLDLVMSSIRWSDAVAPIPNIVVDIGELEPGTLYKLQLLFAEGVWLRGFDIFVNGTQIADDFAPFQFQGGLGITTNGVVFAYEFAAATNNAVVVLDGRGLTAPGIVDRNAILQGFTLENLGAAPAEPKITLAVANANGLDITFDCVVGRTYGLSYKATLSEAAWQDVPSTVTASATSATLTDTTPAHRSAPQGYWRVVLK